jgi:integrase
VVVSPGAHVLSDVREWLFRPLNSACVHAAFSSIPCESALSSRASQSTKRQYTLRHTAITHLVQAGVDLPTVKRISGHKTLSMVERYAHQNGAHMHVAMDKLEARYTMVGALA